MALPGSRTACVAVLVALGFAPLASAAGSLRRAVTIGAHAEALSQEEPKDSDWELLFAGNDGWTGGRSTCGVWGELVGGFRVAGRGHKLTRTYQMPPGLVDAKIEYNFVKIDDWQGEKGTVTVNGKVYYGPKLYAAAGAQVCGHSAPGFNEVKVPIMVPLKPVGENVVEVSSTLVQPAEQASFGITDIKVFGIEAGKCEASLCGPGRLLKEPPPRCEFMECEEDECCDDAPTCDAGVCRRGQILKQSLPRHCAAEPCERRECCDDLPRCEQHVCSAGQILKRLQPHHCRATACTSKECCDDLPRCAASRCVAGRVLKQPPPEFCKDLSCTDAECCDDSPKCKPSDCRSPKVVSKQAPAFCKDRKCTEAECCETLSKPIKSDTRRSHPFPRALLVAVAATLPMSGLGPHKLSV